jgi:hypothetical protein
LSLAVLALPAENSKGGLAHKALLIASARAADDEIVFNETFCFLMNDLTNFLLLVRCIKEKQFVALILTF